MAHKTDIEIAYGAVMKPIGEIALKMGLQPDDVEQYGNYMAKISCEARRRKNPRAKMVLVTAITPTPFANSSTTSPISTTPAT